MRATTTRRASTQRSVAPKLTYRTEIAFRKAVEEQCRSNGWQFYHITDSRSVSAKEGKGFPDLVIMRPPCLLFVELKLEYNSPDVNQLRWIHGLRKCKQEAYVLTPKNFPLFINSLKYSTTYIEKRVIP